MNLLTLTGKQTVDVIVGLAKTSLPLMRENRAKRFQNMIKVGHKILKDGSKSDLLECAGHLAGTLEATNESLRKCEQMLDDENFIEHMDEVGLLVDLIDSTLETHLEFNAANDLMLKFLEG